MLIKLIRKMTNGFPSSIKVFQYETNPRPASYSDFQWFSDKKNLCKYLERPGSVWFWTSGLEDPLDGVASPAMSCYGKVHGQRSLVGLPIRLGSKSRT